MTTETQETILHLPIPADLHRALKAEAAIQGIALKEMVATYLTEGLDKDRVTVAS